MLKIFSPDRIKLFLVMLICCGGISTSAMGADRFAVTVGAHDKLVIFGPKGDRVAEFSIPAIAQPVTIGDVSFQVSYGRDANGQLTAILTSSDTAPAQLHFNVLGKGIDADKAVVTLTFSPNLKSVTVDPGYVGNVEVNSRRLGHHHMADDTSAPQVIAPPDPASLAAATTTTASAAASVSPANTPVVSAEIAPASSPESASSAFPHAPAPLASQLAPILGQDNSEAASDGATPLPATPSAVATTTTAPRANVKLYWSEPVTPPNGHAPEVGLNEIKLVEVHGPVSITLPHGETKTGVEGMIVPSGSKVNTLDNASAALFMGGVNSARLLPRCELTVTQSFDGAVRKTLIDLQRGAVFSRVGQRSGETQDYQIRTPEGVTDAKTSEICSFRGNLDDLHGPATTMNSGLVLDPKKLLAWNPMSFGHGLISDVVDPVLAAEDSPTGSRVSTYFYFAREKDNMNSGSVSHIVIPSNELPSLLGLKRNSPNTSFINDPDGVLQAILIALQPFNFKLHDLLYRFNSGTGTPGDTAFYHNLITVFFGQQLPALIDKYKGQRNAFDRAFDAASKTLKEDLEPFGTNPLTPF